MNGVEVRVKVAGQARLNSYRLFIKYCVFILTFWIFPNSASSAAALVFYLPRVCTHTDTEEYREKQESGIYQNLRKNTIFKEHPVLMSRFIAK